MTTTDRSRETPIAPSTRAAPQGSVRDLIAELSLLEERARGELSDADLAELTRRQGAIVRELRRRRTRLRRENRGPLGTT